MTRTDFQTIPGGWRWDHSYSQLPELFFEQTGPRPVARPAWVILNTRLAETLGLDPDVLHSDQALHWFSGNRIPDGAVPLAQAYAGHQYGHFTALGDGRAILLGEHITPDGSRVDIQLKGSGRTRFSRGGDGRAALGPMLREYLISEAMAALGIPTTRALAVVSTGERVIRDHPLPGAVLTRVAASHIRIGTFQWAAAHEDIPALRALLAHTISRHDPGIDPSDARGFFESTVRRQIQLVVGWMRVGFVHGVMNTDNVALSGETIDYGPCAFMDAYDPDAVFSSIDRGGRYAFANQPSILRWNLARLAEALLPLFDDNRAAAADYANDRLGRFEADFHVEWLRMMRGKTGLLTAADGDASLIQDLLDHMHHASMDYTLTFRSLIQSLEANNSHHATTALGDWLPRWRDRLAIEPGPTEESIASMRRSNPAVIPRNHRVQQALDAAEHGDIDLFHRLLAALSTPDQEPTDRQWIDPPAPGTPKCVTFCGT